MEALKDKKVLISGASFAGLSMAYWMSRYGCRVTVVELANGFKKGGTPVNIMGNTVAIVRRMGILDELIAHQIRMEMVEFKNADDVTERTDLIQQDQAERGHIEYEIERDLLLQLLSGLLRDKVEFIFDDSIAALTEAADSVGVTLKSGQQRSFDLVFGCDGIHSVVRKLCFGAEAEFSHFLQAYFSITIVPKLLIPERTTHMYSEPGKTIMLNAYNNKTDIVLNFFSGQELPYDHRDEAQQRGIIAEQFAGTGWRTPELLQEIAASETFYFDKLCQMKMPSWTKGRVALVGDAGYCASPAAGRGGSLAIDGAAALAAAFEKCNGDFEQAFREYNRSFRPFIEEIQAEVVDYNLEALLPRTEEAIRKRNKEGWGF